MSFPVSRGTAGVSPHVQLPDCCPMTAAAAAASGRECMFAEKCQVLPARSAAEQFPFGALCEPASLLIYLLVKEITIAVITGRYVSQSGVGLTEWCRVGVAEPAPQEVAIKRSCLEWYRDSSPSVGLRPETRASRVWDWGSHGTCVPHDRGHRQQARLPDGRHL